MKTAKLPRLLPAVSPLVFALSWSRALVAQRDHNAATPAAHEQQLPGTTNQQHTAATAVNSPASLPTHHHETTSI